MALAINSNGPGTGSGLGERAHLVQIAINEIYGPGMMLNYTDNEIEMWICTGGSFVGVWAEEG